MLERLEVTSAQRREGMGSPKFRIDTPLPKKTFHLNEGVPEDTA
jgi:hypothetical protein